MARLFKISDAEFQGEGVEFGDGAALVRWSDGAVGYYPDIAEYDPAPIYQESQFWVDLRRDLEQDPEFRKQFVLDAVRLAVAQLSTTVKDEMEEREATYMAAVADYGTGRADGHADGGFVESEVDADTPPAILIPEGRRVAATMEEAQNDMMMYGDVYIRVPVPGGLEVGHISAAGQSRPAGPDEKILQGKVEDGYNGC